MLAGARGRGAAATLSRGRMPVSHASVVENAHDRRRDSSSTRFLLLRRVSRLAQAWVLPACLPWRSKCLLSAITGKCRDKCRMKLRDQRWNFFGLPLCGMARMGLKWSACLRIIIKHKRTRPYRLQANDKAERFIRTTLKERAYAQAYTRSRQGKGSVICRSGHTAMPMRGRSRNPPASSLGTG